MIKFWKSASKGKSGCPVRPPEMNAGNTADVRLVLNVLLNEEYEDQLKLFEKKSKLSLSLHEILIEKKALKYFIQYMEAIDKHWLIRCWLELDHFRIFISEMELSGTTENRIKINRTRSFECGKHCDFPPSNKNLAKSQRFGWRELGKDVFLSTSDLNNKLDHSAGSCGNLDELLESKNCDKSENIKSVNLSEEAVKLFKKYVALEAPYQLDLPDGYRKSVISDICQPEGHIKGDCFKPVQDLVFNQFQNNYYNEFLNSPFYIKAQIDILTNGSLNLKDILYNETILFYFTEYVEQESCRILLEFLMAVMHFRENVNNGNTSNGDQAQADAIVLYDKYISLQAISPVGFPTEIRLKIESDICREGGPLATCFDMPYRIVFNTLSQYVKTFLESEIYYKYLSEMVHSVDNMWSSTNKPNSDCSSEFSISTTNTLLAMGDPAFRSKKRNHSVPDMTIDSNQLYNADALWQRNRQDGLSLGRVNSLGRFESKFEPDPDKKDRSVFKKMVSKFVPRNTSKVEEEMAWQIAHMIVKDVTDLTMAPPDNDDI